MSKFTTIQIDFKLSVCEPLSQLFSVSKKFAEQTLYVILTCSKSPCKTSIFLCVSLPLIQSKKNLNTKAFPTRNCYIVCSLSWFTIYTNRNLSNWKLYTMRQTKPQKKVNNHSINK